MLVLWAIHRDGAEKELRVHPGEVEVLGRRARRLTLDDSRVSRRHARVWYENDTWWLADLDSTHGTWVNHDQIDQPAPLRVGDEIRIGRMLLVVREADATVREAAGNPDGLAPREPGPATPEPHAPPADAAVDPKHATDSGEEPGGGREALAAPDGPPDAAPRSTPALPMEDPEPRTRPAPAPLALADEAGDEGHAPASSPVAPRIDHDPSAQTPAPAQSSASTASTASADDTDAVPGLDDESPYPADARPALTADAQRDAIIQNFGVVFPSSGSADHAALHGHHARRGRRGDGGRSHGRWITWGAFAFVGAMIVVAVVVWLLVPQ